MFTLIQSQFHYGRVGVCCCKVPAKCIFKFVYIRQKSVRNVYAITAPQFYIYVHKAATAASRRIYLSREHGETMSNIIKPKLKPHVNVCSPECKSIQTHNENVAVYIGAGG